MTAMQRSVGEGVGEFSPGPASTPSTDDLDHSDDEARHRDRRAAWAVGLLLVGVYWLTMGGHTYSVDGETYLAGTRALLHHTTVLQPSADLDGVVIAVSNKHDGLTTAAGIGTLLLFAPGYVLGRIASVPFPDSSKEEVVRLVYLAANPLMTAVTAALLLLLCRTLGASRRSSTLLALVFGLGTWAWPHGMTDFSEPGTAMLVTAATLAAIRWWRAPSVHRGAVVGLLAGCAGLTRPSTLLFVPILLLAGLTARSAERSGSRARAKELLAFCVGGVPPALLFAANAYLRFGSPLDNGYPNLAYSTPVYEGVFGLFLSSGKGLFWYAPICLVALFGLRRAYLAQRRFCVVVAAILALHLAVYSRFEIWSGENAYGPRYLIPVLPLLVALVAPVIDTGAQWVRGARIAGVVGFVVPGLLGSLLYFNGVYSVQQPEVLRNLQLTTATPRQQYLAWNFQPRSSPLMLELRSIPDLIDNSWERIAGGEGGLTPIPVAYEERIHWYARAIELDTWWSWWSARDDAALGYVFLLAPAGALAVSARTFRRNRGASRTIEATELT